MNKMKKNCRAAYEQPQIEVCVAEPYKFLAASDPILNGGHEVGGDDGTIGDDIGGGAKGFGLDDGWGKLRGLGPDESWGDLWGG